MPSLKRSERDRLPDSAFAYIDSRGARHLPIHDEPHLRNAMARFHRTRFEDDAARERARQRVLRAARRYGIVPVGFVDGLLRNDRGETARKRLPSGRVTLLLTDIEGSTQLLARLGERYTGVLADVRSIIRGVVRAARGHEVDCRADEFFAVFTTADAAARAATDIHRRLAERAWPDGERPAIRAGVHTGEPTLTDAGYVGLDVHIAARVCSAAHGGQTLVSDAAARAISESTAAASVSVRRLGAFELHGLAEPMELHEVRPATRRRFPAPRVEAYSYRGSDAE